MASPSWWTWVWVNSGSWWWIGKPSVLWFMGLQRVGHNRVTELNWMSLTSHSQWDELLLNCSVMSESSRYHGPQHTRPLCPSSTLGVLSNSCSLSRWCHLTISSSVVPFFYSLQSSQHQSLFKWVSSSHQVAKVLEFQLQHQSFQWTLRTDLL